MSKHPQTSTDDQAFKVAYLKAEQRRSQKEIGAALGMSQAAVSRALERARKLGCIQDFSRFVHAAGMRDGLIQELESLLDFSDLAGSLKNLATPNGLTVRHLRVFDSGSTDATPEGVERRQVQFGRAAATYVAERVRQAVGVGVAWGSTLSRVIDGMARAGYPWAGEQTRQFVPVSGEPMQYAPSEYTASALARRLDALVNGPRAGQTGTRDAGQEHERRLALTGVPAFIPADVDELLRDFDDLTPEARAVLAQQFGRALKRFFEQNSPAYRRIFTEDPPLVGRLDMLLTSAGGSRLTMGFCNDELRKLGKIKADELEHLIVGDLGGVLLPRLNASPDDLAKVRALSAMWTGITYQQLEDIARRAAKQPSPGVVVVSLGAARSAVICEVLVRGLCTELIVDRDLAQALEQDLPRRVAGTRFTSTG